MKRRLWFASIILCAFAFLVVASSAFAKGPDRATAENEAAHPELVKPGKGLNPDVNEPPVGAPEIKPAITKGGAGVKSELRPGVVAGHVEAPRAAEVKVEAVEVARPEKVEKPDVIKPEKLEKPEVARPERVEKPEVARPERIEKPEVIRPERVERPEVTRPEKVEKPEVIRPEKIEKPDKAGKD